MKSKAFGYLLYDVKLIIERGIFEKFQLSNKTVFQHNIFHKVVKLIRSEITPSFIKTFIEKKSYKYWYN